MVLAAVGDAVGYRGSRWEFQKSDSIIHREFDALTKRRGCSGLHVDMRWRYSDDTVMHHATARGLLLSVATASCQGQAVAKQYKQCWRKMRGRSPGETCCKAIVSLLNKECDNWDKKPFTDRGGGCGGAMRTACVGLAYPRLDELPDLIRAAVECCRITHHHPTAYLGAVTAAVFTSYALNDIPAREWGARLLNDVIPAVKQYVSEAGREVGRNLAAFAYFETAWTSYLKLRHILSPKEDDGPVFPTPYGATERFVAVGPVRSIPPHLTHTLCSGEDSIDRSPSVVGAVQAAMTASSLPTTPCSAHVAAGCVSACLASCYFACYQHRSLTECTAVAAHRTSL